MPKITNILFTIVFSIGCFGLWLILVLFESIYPLRLAGSLPALTHLFLAKKFLFLIIPIPFLLLSAFIAFRKQPTTEVNLLYLGILAVIFSLLVISVTVAVSIPWIPIIY